MATPSSPLQHHYPWTHAPLLASAPMHTIASPTLALAVSAAGGLGFIGPSSSPAVAVAALEEAEKTLHEDEAFARIRPSADAAYRLPLGVGFLLWDSAGGGVLGEAVEAVKRFRPAGVWLYAPGGEMEGEEKEEEGSGAGAGAGAARAQAELATWAKALRAASPGVKVWMQVGTVSEAVAAAAEPDASARPDVLVLQGAEAGGHGRATDAAPLSVLVPETADALRCTNPSADIALAAAGGISDGRGVVAALALGASAAVMGTAFLASPEARVPPGYRNAVLAASEGGKTTTRTLLYNHLRGVYGWPKAYSPRVLKNRSWEEVEREGVPFEEVKKRHDELRASGGAETEGAWGREGRLGVYAGMGVGLVKVGRGAGEVVRGVREEAGRVVGGLV